MDAHTAKIKAAFLRAMDAEDEIRAHETELREQTARLKLAIAEAETREAAAWKEIEGLMAESGEPEVRLPGAVSDYLIGWSNPRESVKGDPDAAPDEFVVIERKLKKKEVGEHLKKLRDAGETLPNWCSFEKGERKLMWKTVKRGAA